MSGNSSALAPSSALRFTQATSGISSRYLNDRRCDPTLPQISQIGTNFVNFRISLSQERR